MPLGDYNRKWKLFERYVDDIVCAVKDDPKKLLQHVSDLQLNLEFTLEALNDKCELAFLDMTVHVNEQRMIIVYGTKNQQTLGLSLISEVVHHFNTRRDSPYASEETTL